MKNTLFSKGQLLLAVDSDCTGCELPKTHRDALVARIDRRIVFLCAQCCAEFKRDGWHPETSAYFLSLMYGGAE